MCRIGTHLFHFAEYVNALRGWGRGLRNAVGGWYVSREADDLAHQAVKYQQRDGWSHGDLLRLAHPKAPSTQHDAVFRWMLCGSSASNGADSMGEREVKRKVRGEDRVAKYGAVGGLPKLIEAFEQAKRALELLSPLIGADAQPGQQVRQLPAFVGIGDSGRSDISEHLDDLLAGGFGE